VDQYKKHDDDTGSSEVQIALLNNRIKKLTEHLRHNQKDHHSDSGRLCFQTKTARYIRQKKQRFDDYQTSISVWLAG